LPGPCGRSPARASSSPVLRARGALHVTVHSSLSSLSFSIPPPQPLSPRLHSPSFVLHRRPPHQHQHRRQSARQHALSPRQQNPPPSSWCDDAHAAGARRAAGPCYFCAVDSQLEVPAISS
jgi:hypothetical protein